MHVCSRKTQHVLRLGPSQLNALGRHARVDDETDKSIRRERNGPYARISDRFWGAMEHLTLLPGLPCERNRSDSPAVDGEPRRRVRRIFGPMQKLRADTAGRTTR